MTGVHVYSEDPVVVIFVFFVNCDRIVVGWGKRASE